MGKIVCGYDISVPSSTSSVTHRGCSAEQHLDGMEEVTCRMLHMLWDCQGRACFLLCPCYVVHGKAKVETGSHVFCIIL